MVLIPDLRRPSLAASAWEGWEDKNPVFQLRSSRARIPRFSSIERLAFSISCVFSTRLDVPTPPASKLLTLLFSIRYVLIAPPCVPVVVSPPAIEGASGNLHTHTCSGLAECGGSLLSFQVQLRHPARSPSASVTVVVNHVRRHVQASVNLPRGYHIDYGGQFESEAEASRLLLWLGLAVVLGILVILTAAFCSFTDAVIIMFNLPLALIGGVVGVFLSGGVLSVASIIGFITLFGIASRNGIMMISHIKHLMEHEGVTNFREAVLRGAIERLSPILMTALAAGLALIPLALGAGKPGSEIEAPMAIVILFGLLSSTFLNMVVVPAVYFRFGSRLG